MNAASDDALRVALRLCLLLLLTGSAVSCSCGNAGSSSKATDNTGPTAQSGETASGDVTFPDAEMNPGTNHALVEQSTAIAASLEAVGASEKAAENTADADLEPLEMVFVGDVMFGRWRETGLDAVDYKNFDVFGRVHDLLSSDLTLANLETPLVRELPEEAPYGTRLRFAAPPEAVDVLIRAGIDAVTLANNHSFDMKHLGLEQTPRILREKGVPFIGQTRKEPPLFRVEPLEAAGWTIGFLAATGERNGPQRENAPELPYVHINKMTEVLAPVVREARGRHDLLIVVLHWGLEYKDKPTTRQIRAARSLIDAGADAVICHHPHVLQAIERYKDGLIAYSLGNFLFDNTTHPQRLTGILRLTYQPGKKCLERAVLHPAHVLKHPTHHPLPANKGTRRMVRERVTSLSKDKPFVTEWRNEGRDLVLASPECQPTSSAIE